MSSDAWSWLIALALCGLAYAMATISRRRAAKKPPEPPEDERSSE